ncbi:hypothetical protein TRAPUB_2260 [Trametes pubescens]|uniref:Uncharacterized protein n=1 Tax=Trametes pubescens TaxID=154538 RepID=A0A1M2VH22_TRAPU|nr:hypothetical protein TRAPUB_2260 [Trametes pubescens]
MAVWGAPHLWYLRNLNVLPARADRTWNQIECPGNLQAADGAQEPSRERSAQGVLATGVAKLPRATSFGRMPSARPLETLHSHTVLLPSDRHACRWHCMYHSQEWPSLSQHRLSPDLHSVNPADIWK